MNKMNSMDKITQMNKDYRMIRRSLIWTSVSSVAMPIMAALIGISFIFMGVSVAAGIGNGFSESGGILSYGNASFMALAATLIFFILAIVCFVCYMVFFIMGMIAMGHYKRGKIFMVVEIVLLSILIASGMFSLLTLEVVHVIHIIGCVFSIKDIEEMKRLLSTKFRPAITGQSYEESD